MYAGRHICSCGQRLAGALVTVPAGDYTRATCPACPQEAAPLPPILVPEEYSPFDWWARVGWWQRGWNWLSSGKQEHEDRFVPLPVLAGLGNSDLCHLWLTLYVVLTTECKTAHG